jgi:hypothetical protein
MVSGGSNAHWTSAARLIGWLRRASKKLVGVTVLGDDHVCDQAREPPQQPPVIVIYRGQGQSQHPTSSLPSSSGRNTRTPSGMPLPLALPHRACSLAAGPRT